MLIYFRPMAVALLFSVIICLVISLSEAQEDLTSPCPRLFVYEPRTSGSDRWYGIVTLVSEDTTTGVWLKLTFDRPTLQLGVS